MVLVGLVAANAVGFAMGVVLAPPMLWALRRRPARIGHRRPESSWVLAPITVETRRDRPTIVPMRSFLG